MNFLKHLIIKITGLAVIFGIPIYIYLFPLVFRSGNTDAISGATMISSEAVSGEYVILINSDMHKKKGTTEDWAAFFKGESSLIFDDISCLVATGDNSGNEFADICKARLPENQMTITKINGLMMVSKADHSKFDVIVMSREFAEVFSVYNRKMPDNIRIVYVSGE